MWSNQTHWLSIVELTVLFHQSNFIITICLPKQKRHADLNRQKWFFWLLSLDLQNTKHFCCFQSFQKTKLLSALCNFFGSVWSVNLYHTGRSERENCLCKDNLSTLLYLQIMSQISNYYKQQIVSACCNVCLFLRSWELFGKKIYLSKLP